MLNEPKIKIIANYLPQFHRIPENDRWWGEGFTDWVGVKNARSLYKWQTQPRVPLNDYYYDLSDINAIKWQVNLAKKYGIYGFGIYHYWFNSEQILLQKPAELLRDNENINMNYLFIWDNVSWKRTWEKIKNANDYAPAFDVSNEGDNKGILAELNYGNREDWKKHFDYLLPFFKDGRYIKVNNKPVFVIFNPRNNISILKEMFKYWDLLARDEGFDGMFTISRANIAREIVNEYEVLYEPGYSSLEGDKNIVSKALVKMKRNINRKIGKPDLYLYEDCWKRVIKTASKLGKQKIYYSGFVGFDDTARRGRKARIIKGDSPEIFGKYFTKLLRISKSHGKDYVFLTAWNEWGEGAYLEPDARFGMAYLEAVKRAVKSVNGE